MLYQTFRVGTRTAPIDPTKRAADADQGVASR
jgi:hypothetical protein